MKANKIVVAILLVLTGIATGNAQQVEWGLKAGYNLSTVADAPEGIKSDFRSGYHLGGLADVRISEKVSVQPELLYSTEGAKTIFQVGDEIFSIDSREDIKLIYLNFPVMAKFHLVNSLNLEAGPQVSYLLDAKSEYDFFTLYRGERYSESGTDDLIGEVNSLSFGFNVGLGYGFRKDLFLQVRYHLGISSIADEETSDDEPGVDMNNIKNSGFQFSLGYKF